MSYEIICQCKAPLPIEGNSAICSECSIRFYVTTFQPKPVTEEFDLFRKYRQGLYIYAKEYTVAHLTNKDNHIRPWEYSKQAIIPEVVESVICNVPLKPIILRDEYNVVFGHGILATLNWFVEGKTVQTRFRKTPLLFSDLCPSDQRRFLNYDIRSLNVELKNEKGEEMLDLLLKNWRGFWTDND